MKKSNKSNCGGWVKPRFTAADLVLTDESYGEVSYLKCINDSMEIDSAGEDLAWLETSVKTRSGKTIKIDICLRAVGDVRVYFKGECYRCASKMPKELIECYHNGTDPLELDEEYSCINNNWFEEMFYIRDEKGVICNDGYVEDCSGDYDWKNGFIKDAVELLNSWCLPSFFGVGDKVRWEDPDKSLSHQMTKSELKKYREREFEILEIKYGDFAVIGDGDSEIEVPYSELLTSIQSSFTVTLTKQQLELLSDICHDYKDGHRGWEEAIIPVMSLEASLKEQTGGEYEPDTTYDIKNNS